MTTLAMFRFYCGGEKVQAISVTTGDGSRARMAGLLYDDAIWAAFVDYLPQHDEVTLTIAGDSAISAPDLAGLRKALAS